jgi:hypothetical protein
MAQAAAAMGEDVCIDAAASRLKQADLYASLRRMGHMLEDGWSAVVSIRRAGNSAGTKVRMLLSTCCGCMMAGESCCRRFYTHTSRAAVCRRLWFAACLSCSMGPGSPIGVPIYKLNTRTHPPNNAQLRQDTYFWSPQGKRFRSKKEVAAYLAGDPPWPLRGHMVEIA